MWFPDDEADLWPRSSRNRIMGSLGLIGFLTGVFTSGRLLIWCGKLNPGVTFNSEILNFWPIFLTGGFIGGFVLIRLARVICGWHP